MWSKSKMIEPLLRPRLEIVEADGSGKADVRSLHRLGIGEQAEGGGADQRRVGLGDVHRLVARFRWAARAAAAGTAAAELGQPQLGLVAAEPQHAARLADHLRHGDVLVVENLAVIDHPVVIDVEHVKEPFRIGQEFRQIQFAVVVRVRLLEPDVDRIGGRRFGAERLAHRADEQHLGLVLRHPAAGTARTATRRAVAAGAGGQAGGRQHQGQQGQGERTAVDHHIISQVGTA